MEILDENIKIAEATSELKEQTLDIAQKIVVETDTSKVKDLTQLFNAAHVKKQVLRSMAYDNLLDHIQNQMTERIVQRGDQFSNKDLLDYANSVTTHLEKAQKQILGVEDIPLIQFNQQNNTVITETLDVESQQRVENAINAFLKRIKAESTMVKNQEDYIVYDGSVENFNNNNGSNDITIDGKGDN